MDGGSGNSPLQNSFLVRVMETENNENPTRNFIIDKVLLLTNDAGYFPNEIYDGVSSGQNKMQMKIIQMPQEYTNVHCKTVFIESVVILEKIFIIHGRKLDFFTVVSL